MTVWYSTASRRGDVHRAGHRFTGYGSAGYGHHAVFPGADGNLLLGVHASILAIEIGIGSFGAQARRLAMGSDLHTADLLVLIHPHRDGDGAAVALAGDLHHRARKGTVGGLGAVDGGNGVVSGRPLDRGIGFKGIQRHLIKGIRRQHLSPGGPRPAANSCSWMGSFVTALVKPEPGRPQG